MKFYAGIGSRETPADVQHLMIALGAKLGREGWTLRSGGADGADKAFEIGADNVSASKAIYRPEHAGEKELILAAQFHPAWHRCSEYARKLHARNVLQVLGAIYIDDERPAHSAFVVCWTKDGLASGGTGQAIRIAEAYGIPVRNLHDPKTREAAERFVRGER